MMWGYDFNWPGMTLMMLGMTLWIVLLIVIVWTVIRWLNTRTTSSTQQPQTLAGHGPTARDILSQRYARGEIDATPFEEMRARLEASDNAYQRSQAEGRRSVGEKLFDGPRNGVEIV